MTKSFLINTSVAAIVSAFVFTGGVSSAHAWGETDQYGHASRSDTDKGGSYGTHYAKRYNTHYAKRYGTHYPKRYNTHYAKRYNTHYAKRYGTHYPRRYSHNPYYSYGLFGSYGSYGTHYPRRYSHNPYAS
jgi:hypothetical protein